jgi:predicted GIY-YIG superfamily endonuclease
MERTLPEATWLLYPFYDHDEQLLYIGQTVSAPTRFKAHRDGKPWWHEVVYISLERFYSADELDIAEREAIKTEYPLYNIVHNDQERAIRHASWASYETNHPCIFRMPDPNPIGVTSHHDSTH